MCFRGFDSGICECESLRPASPLRLRRTFDRMGRRGDHSLRLLAALLLPLDVSNPRVQIVLRQKAIPRSIGPGFPKVVLRRRSLPLQLCSPGRLHRL